jgi:hypothetical protein
MKTAAQLNEAFRMYLAEVASCEASNCWWALLHMLVAIPDICAALEGRPQGAKRYVDWCDQNFARSSLSPADRYQIRCALLHEGTTLAPKSNYTVFSFIDPRATSQVDQLVESDTTRHGQMCTVNVKWLADGTRTALQTWLSRIAQDATLNPIVEMNLKNLATIKPKQIKAPPTRPGGTALIIKTFTTSSS